jgi:PAS domain-containing protein
VPSSAISLVYAFDAVIALTAALVMWCRREAPGATALAGMLFAAAFWALCDAIELQVRTVPLKQLVSQIQYFGVVAAAPAYFEAAMALSGYRPRMTPSTRVAVWAVPLLSLLCAWTNDAHHWLWTRITLPAGDSPFATYEYGWWFWVLTAQNYVLMVAGSAALIRGLREVSRGFRTAMAVVLVATILPWLGNAAYNLKLGPWPGLNWLTLSLGVSGWLLVWVVLRGGLLDLLPHAREALLEMMTDAVLVIDRKGAISFSNRAARETGLDAASLIGPTGVIALRELPMDWQGEFDVTRPSGTAMSEVDRPALSRVKGPALSRVEGPALSDVQGAAVIEVEERRWLDVRIGPVFDRWGAPAGRLVVGRDITLQKRLEDEREQLIDELRDAVRRVTQLEGLLPVCAACRNVNDGTGGWTSMEKYIAAHTPLEFTHGICPDCMTRLYPEILDPA